MRRTLGTLPLLLAAAAAACRAPAPEGGPAPRAAAYGGPLVSSLQVEAGRDSVLFRLQVTNPTAGPVRLTFPSGMTHDFAVTDRGREVWRWSAGRHFPQALVQLTVAAGDTRTYTEVWRPAAALRGRPLVAEGRLTSSDHPLRQSTPITLP
jgi:hypothetical protein